MKKIKIFFGGKGALIFVIAIVLGLVGVGIAYATNTYSILLYSGSNQYLRILNNIGITDGQITMEGWFKLVSEPTSANYQVMVHGDSGTNVLNYVYYDGTGPTRALHFSRGKGGVGGDNVAYNVNLGIGIWHHIAYTYDGTYVRGYLDGVLVAGPIPSNGDGTSGVNDEFALGQFVDSVPSYNTFDGNIDEVRVWNTALDVATIANHYNNPTELVGNESGLVAYYKLENNLLDSTANHYDMTGFNGPTFSMDTPFGIPPPVLVLGARKQVTETRSASATLADDSDLKLTLAANKEYVISGTVFVSSTGPKPDVKIGFDSPSGTEMDVGVISTSQSGVVLLQAPGDDTGGIAVNSNQITAIEISGTIKTSADVGQFNLEWAQNVSNAASTSVLRGSYLKAEEI